MRKWNQVGPIAHALLVALFVLVSISALLPLVFVAIISLSSITLRVIIDVNV